MSFEDFMVEFNKELGEMIQTERDQYFKDHGLDPSASPEELGKKVYAEGFGGLKKGSFPWKLPLIILNGLH